MSSRIDQFIDAVAFGKAKPPTGPCLGLYLSPETVYLAQTHVSRNGGISVEHLVRIPIPIEGKSPVGTMTMNADFLSDQQKIAGQIRKSISLIRWNTANVVVSLSHHLGLLRYFPMPAMARRYLPTAVPIEAKKYIPIPFDALTRDFQTDMMPPDASGKQRLGVLIAVTQNKNLPNIAGLLKSLGLNLIGLELAPCSVLRLWQAVDPPKGPETFVQAHFDGGNVRVLICDRGLPVFFREVFLGATASVADHRKVDMTGCLSFAQKQLGLSAVSKIKLSGAPAALEPWKEAFAAETGLPAQIQDTAKMLLIKGGDWGSCAAIGASARTTAPSPVTIDLAMTNRVGEDERQVARDIIAVGAALAVLIAGIGLFQMLTYNHRAKALLKYQIAPDVKSALSGLQPGEIDAKLAEMREQSVRLRAISDASREPLSAILRKIVELMPDNMWLIGVTTNNSLMGERGALDIHLRGRVRGETGADEQAVAFQFQSALLNDPKLGKIFDVHIAMQGRTTEPDRAVALDPEALARSFEDRTEFFIEMKEKR